MRVFCPTCRTMREVMDTYETDDGDSRGVTTSRIAQPLECGHDAGDGGGTPYRGRPTSPEEMRRKVQAVVEAQEGADGGEVE